MLGQPRDARFLEVVGRHLHELGLRRRAGRGTARQNQIRQLVIGLEIARFGIEGCPRDARRLRLGPERGDELGEGGIGGMRSRNARHKNHRERDKRGSHFTAMMKILGKRNRILPSACGR